MEAEVRGLEEVLVEEDAHMVVGVVDEGEGGDGAWRDAEVTLQAALGGEGELALVEAMLDGFDLETYRTMRVQHFEISYHAEGRYGTPLALFRRKFEPGAFACALVDGDRAVSRALIRFV